MGDDKVVGGVFSNTTMRAEERATENTIQHEGINTISPVSSLEDMNNFSGESARDALEMERDKTINNKEVLINHDRHKMYDRHMIIYYQLKGMKVPAQLLNAITSDSYQELEEYKSEIVPAWIEKMIPLQCNDPHIILDFKVSKNMPT